MKIAAISDVHGNLLALQTVLAEIDREGVDVVINCGDTLSGPLEPAKTADLLMDRGITMIAGNYDRQLLTLPLEQLEHSDTCAAREIHSAQRTWLSSAPPTMWLNEDVFICHGTPTSDLQYWLETVTPDFGQHGSRGVRAASPEEIVSRMSTGEHTRRASLIICGHTHMPRMVQVCSADEGDGHAITIVNPGSVGLPGYDDIHPHPHWIETGSPHARYALMEKTQHGWSVQLRSAAYDFEPMARLAEQPGRPDWAQPLRTGRMR